MESEALESMGWPAQRFECRCTGTMQEDDTMVKAGGWRPPVEGKGWMKHDGAGDHIEHCPSQGQLGD